MPNLSCTCGNVIPVPDDATVTRIRCRQCGTAHTMQMAPSSAPEAAAAPPAPVEEAAAPAPAETPPEVSAPPAAPAGLADLPSVDGAYADAPKRKGAGKLVAIVVVVLLLGGGGFAAWWFLLRGKTATPPVDAGPRPPAKAAKIKVASKAEPAEVAIYNADIKRAGTVAPMDGQKFVELTLEIDPTVVLEGETAIAFKPTEFALHDGKGQKIVEAKWLFDDAKAAFIPDEMVEKRTIDAKPDKVGARLLFMVPADAVARTVRFRSEPPAPVPPK